jgi:translation initiation factor IF-2
MNQGEKTTVKLILKADGPTTLEALNHAIDQIPTPDNVEIKKVHSDIGQFTESDLSLAQASEALLIGFNVKIPGTLKKKAEQLKVTLKSYDIIYELTEYIEELAMGLLKIEMVEVVVGKLDVLGVFFRKAKEMVIGGKCIEGTITNGDKFHIIRGDEQIGQGTITSLQKEQQSVKTITEGHECGMKVRISKVIEE